MIHSCQTLGLKFLRVHHILEDDTVPKLLCGFSCPHSNQNESIKKPNQPKKLSLKMLLNYFNHGSKTSRLRFLRPGLCQYFKMAQNCLHPYLQILQNCVATSTIVTGIVPNPHQFLSCGWQSAVWPLLGFGLAFSNIKRILFSCLKMLLITAKFPRSTD